MYIINHSVQVLRTKKGRKNVDLTSEDNNKYSVCVQADISKIQQLEESLKSKVVNNLFPKPKDSTVPIGNVFESQYREKKGSNIQEISLMHKSNCCKNRNIRSTAEISPLVNLQVTKNIKTLVSNV